VEDLVDGCRAQVLGAGEFSRSVVDVVLEYLDHEDPRDEVMVLVDYCVDWAREVGGLGLFQDRTLADDLEQQLVWCLERQLHRLQFDELMCTVGDGLRAGDEDARTTLVDLCANGVHSHPRLFSPTGWGSEVLRLAYDHAQSRALDAALRPHHRGRLAGRHRDRGAAYWLALAYLGHLAADPVQEDAACIARSALVELSGHAQIGADAAVRLPPHLLDADERAELLDVVQRREDIERTWGGHGFDMQRDRRETELMRTVLWQAADCSHAGITI
jgi:hypothetical protein